MRTSVRAKWWIPIQPGMTHEEAAIAAGEIFMGTEASRTAPPFQNIVKRRQRYFYWLSPEGVKAPLTSDIVFVIYSSGYGGPLVAIGSTASDS